MVVARFAHAAVAGLPLEIHGDGSQTRTFCHVEDTIRAVHGLMDDPSTSGEIFNVGSRNWISILELAKRILELTESDSELVYVPYEQVYGLGIDDMLHRVPAIEKIEAAIGWVPERTLDEILADVIAFARAELASVG
jgi:nucleoside-diphosphate-sugar epimerase